MDLADVTAFIRIDVGTNKGSVIDVIRLVNPTEANAAKTAARLPEDLSSRCTLLRINGKERLSPVADFGTLIQVIFALPGKTARAFRARSAHQVCRLMGGDMRIIAEVVARHKWWQETAARREVQQALLAPPPAGRWDEFSGTSDTTRECDVRDDLALALGGSIEIETPAGFADVITATHVIEVKNWRNWKHALGQVLAYHAFASDKRMRIHLFADECDQVAAQSTVTIATGVCAKYDVDVTLEVRSSDMPPAKRPK